MSMYSRINSPSRAASRTNSRPASRGPTETDDNELLNGISFGNIDELISSRLAQFMKNQDSDMTKSTQKYPMHNVKGLSDLLRNARATIPAEDREMLMNQLYVLNAKTGEGQFEDMVEILRISKGFDLLVATRNAAASAIAHSDDVAEEAIEFLQTLEDKIASVDIDVAAKEQFVYAYSSITLVMYEGSGTYGVDKRLNFLLETLLGILPDQEANAAVIGALAYGMGSLLTLLESSSALNEILENICESTAELLLDSEILAITRPMSMLFALAYEMYNYVDDATDEFYDPEEEQQPYEYTYEIIKRLQELVSTSQTKESKKNKNQGRSIFREAVNTVKTYSDRSERMQFLEKLVEIYKVKKSDDKANILSHIRLTKTRSIAIKSWSSFFRVILLKWAFGPGLYNQLAHNSTLVTMIDQSPSLKFKVPRPEASMDKSDPAFTETVARVSHRRKEKMIASGRAQKLASQLAQSGINDY